MPHSGDGRPRSPVRVAWPGCSDPACTIAPLTPEALAPQTDHERRGVTEVTDPHAAALDPPPETRIVEVVFPEQLNHHGTLFGGEALSMMDRAAFVAVTRYCRSDAVTVAVHEVDFVAPVSHGEIVEVLARVVETGRTSMTVLVSMVSEELRSGKRRLCGKGRFVFVAFDGDGKPVPLPQLSE